MKFFIWIKSVIKKCSLLHKFLVAAQSFIFSIIQRIFFICAKDINDMDSKSCLVIAPHADDETLGCAAVILKARKAGQPVRIVIVTDGRFSAQSSIMTPDEIAALRREEAPRACAVLGVTSENIVFLPFTDCEAEEDKEKISSALLQQIKDFAPQHIFSPYGVDLHPDHQTIAAVVNNLVKSGNITCPVYQYPIWFWNFTAWSLKLASLPKILIQFLKHPCRSLCLRRVSAQDYLDLKKAALAEYRSQCENLTGETGWRLLPQVFLKKFFVPYELFFEIACEYSETKRDCVP